MTVDWVACSTISGVVTAAAAIIALYQSGKQTRISNRQFLFDRRLESWELARRLIVLYGDNRMLIRESISEEKGSEPVFANGLLFVYLTNSSEMNQYAVLAEDVDDEALKRDFLTFLEHMDDSAEEMEVVFPRKEGELIAQFMRRYADALRSMFQYEMLLGHLRKSAKEFRLTLEEAQESVDEGFRRRRLVEVLCELDAAYLAINQQKIRAKISKTMKL